MTVKARATKYHFLPQLQKACKFQGWLGGSWTLHWRLDMVAVGEMQGRGSSRNRRGPGQVVPSSHWLRVQVLEEKAAGDSYQVLILICYLQFLKHIHAQDYSLISIYLSALHIGYFIVVSFYNPWAWKTSLVSMDIGISSMLHGIQIPCSNISFG